MLRARLLILPALLAVITATSAVAQTVTPITYYLSEGATSDFFDTDILIANPNNATAPVTLTFSKESGGMAFFPRFFGEFPNIFRSIAEAMRNQYVLTYTSTNQNRDGKFRKIKVELVNPETNEPVRVLDEKGKPIKYQIIAKAGYTAPRIVE